VKKVLCCLALVAALIPLVGRSAAAQDVKATPVPSLDWIIATRPVPGTLTIQPIRNVPPPQPAYCQPCLFYGGDFDSSSSNANGLANENTLLVPDTTSYIPFNVPGGETWVVSGLFTNDLADGYDGIDPAQATWSISSGVSSGNAGTTIASGTASATFAATGRSGFGFNEYTVRVQLTAPGVYLTPGTYWLSVVPQCTNTGDSNCDIAQYFVSNTPETNSYGPHEPKGKTFFNSSYFGYDWAPACEVTTLGCGAFSAGVEGKSESH
jgi:hypothetical protein